MKKHEIFNLTKKELKLAKQKHPYWPYDLLHAAAIVNEEAGELTRACLNYIYENGKKDEIIKEAAQVSASIFRFLENFDE